MLTGELVRPRLRSRNGELQIDMLDAENRHWLKTANALIALFRPLVGQPQRAWDAALEAYEGDRTDYVVIRGLAKVLADSATFEPLPTPLDPTVLRQRLFAQGPVFDQQDLFHTQTRAETLAALAEETQLEPQHLELILYADRPSEYLLTRIDTEWSAQTLIARYNLELARAALYWSDAMHVEVYDHFKTFWKYLKLFKLMFWATAIPDGYHVELDGPISPFVQSTTRYGRQFAVFLPALFLGERWTMQATTRPPQFDDKLVYRLDQTTPLTSHFKAAALYDSRMEADFAAEFEAKFGSERGKWQLAREDEVLLLGDTVLIPDFSLTHKKDGRRVLIEIVGFWHPEYLKRKLEKVRAARQHNLLLLVYEHVNLTEQALSDVPAEVLYFKTKPVLKDVMAAVERIASAQ
ncbi:MAG: DUF790 family protein [Anaerolinea sp.]|nr:DUF790 family protein [Anaerolinea sp.]